MRRKRNKEPGREQWRASHRESCCRCCLPLSDAAVFALTLPRLSFSCSLALFSLLFFLPSLLFSSFLPLAADNAARQLLPSGPGRLALEN